MPKKAAENSVEIVTVGRRKTSSARVFLRSGTGKITINGNDVDTFFGQGTAWAENAICPISVVGATKKFDFLITVKGGGVTGQSGAIRLGIARALDAFEKSQVAQNDEQMGEISYPWHKLLRSGGFLTRDPRAVLRKIVGRVKARKKKQFSKR